MLRAKPLLLHFKVSPPHSALFRNAQTLLRNTKLARGYQNQRNFALNTRGALKLRRVSSPNLASLKCYAFLRSTPKRAAAPWRVGERDG